MSMENSTCNRVPVFLGGGWDLALLGPTHDKLGCEGIQVEVMMKPCKQFLSGPIVGPDERLPVSHHVLIDWLHSDHSPLPEKVVELNYCRLVAAWNQLMVLTL